MHHTNKQKKTIKSQNIVYVSIVSFQKYVCDKCGKQFTEKSNLTRHMKTHVQSSQAYPCDVCGKEFKRADHRKRHEESHNYTINCPVCGQYFNRRESLLRHRALHESPEVRPMRKRPPSPGPSNSHPKQPRGHTPQSSNSPSIRQPSIRDEPQILPEDPENRVLYFRHWNTIRTEETTGNHIQDKYNFTLRDMTASTFPEMVRRIFRQQTTAFKINLSFGFILRNVETGELRYYHSSQNNARFFETPHLTRTEEDLERFLEELSRHDMLEYIRQQRPDTKWVVHLLTNVTFYVNKLFDHPIGARVVLPDHILKNKAVVALVGGSHGAYTDNLCFFRCLAVHRGVVDVQALDTPAKTYYRQYLQQQDMTPAGFKGVTLDDLVVLEQVFSLNVYVYDLQETEAGDIAARLVRRSPYKYDDTMNLNLYEQHFSYNKDLRSYSHSYLCSKCDRLWKHVGKLHRHERTCTGDVIYKYPGGVYHTTQTVFDRLEDEGINVPEEDRYYPYRATYDIEVMLQPTDKRRSEKLEWTSDHVLLSVSVCSNVPTYTEPICFVTEGDTSDTSEFCLQHLIDISEKAFRLLLPRYGMIFEEIQQRLDQDLEEYKDDEEREREEKKHHLYQLKQQL